MDWPKGPTYWTEGLTLNISVPFTWNLQEVKSVICRGSLAHRWFRVGGPAVEIMPHYLANMDGVSIGGVCPGVLQRVNPEATRTTTGCIRKCQFCAIGTGKIEPGPMRELGDWPDLPILIDNNILGVSQAHFDKVIDRLKKHESCDFNQGLDARLITDYHAKRFRELNNPMLRLACDGKHTQKLWEAGFGTLRRANVPLRSIKSYVLIAFNSGPEECWMRCNWVESHGIQALPMWFHPLDTLEWNAVTDSQRDLGWDEAARKEIMGFFYRHRGERQYA
jgi:hypothetical protein